MFNSLARIPGIPIFLATIASLPASPVVINEIHVDDADSSIDTEFIELLNTSAETVQLDGWVLTGAVEFTFPQNTPLAPGSFIVAASSPASFSAKFPGIPALGPWNGSLRNEGETVRLSDSNNIPIDSVDYQLGFPWPTVGDSPSPSMELINPALDNSLGGSWRSSGNAVSSPNIPVEFISRNSQSWHYHKGDTLPPIDGGGLSWTENGYDHSSQGWAIGESPIGFGDDDDRTELGDMQGNYISVFMRHEFTVAGGGTIPNRLTLRLLYDDGVVVWINGTQAGRYNVPGELGTPLPNPVPDQFADNREADGVYEEFQIQNIAPLLTPGTNVIAAQLINERIGSSDTTFDCELVVPATTTDDSYTPRPPTPGAPNSVFSNHAPPAIRQVKLTPEKPTPGTPVTITAKISDPDGIANASLEYQIVEPGDYINISDPRYQSSWTGLPMLDDGTTGDLTAGDSIYTASLPADIQVHRRLIRYRISANDRQGASVTVPYRDDPTPNFAYFVYGAIPDWNGAVRPGTAETTYSFSQLQPIPVYHLLTTRKHHEDAQYIPDSTLRSGDTGSVYRWQGTLVYNGNVYDHIRFRARGGVWRYAMGKNMWKFDFNRGQRFQAHDDYGRKYKTRWDKLNFSALIQQENIGRRGEQGLFEWAGFRIHNLLGNPAPNTHFVHFRIIEHADENGPTSSQYDTDFQGLYLAVEQMDGQFLDEHDLPDGNLYKMEGGTGELNNQGLGMPTRKQDLNNFMRTWRTATSQADWEQNLDLEDYYSFYAGITFIHDNDIHANKNYFFFNNPESGKWQLLNWDLDLTWTTTYRLNDATNGPIDDFVFRHRDLNRDYRNRLREGIDLLFNTDQAGKLLDECASLVYAPGQPSFVDADRAMWDYNPIMRSRYVNSSKSGQGRYYAKVNPRTYEGIISEMKTYISRRKTTFIDRQSRHLRGESTTIPATPTITYSGPQNYPATELSFTSSSFSDPQGDNTFAAMRWRIGEIYNDDTPNYQPATPFVYEIEPVWESPESSTFAASVSVPPDAIRPGRTYRARVRHKDDSGNWSHWSAPVEFVATAPDVTFYQQNLAISEFLYKPSPATAAESALGFTTSDFEWIELQNLSDSPIDLTNLRFTKGIDFDFQPGTQIPANASALLVKNPDAFEARYGPGLNVLGSFAPDSLSNAGEQLKLSIGAGIAIHDLTYDDTAPWPVEADQGGISLVLLNPSSAPDHSLPENWTVSAVIGGTPGRESSDPYTDWKQQYGIISDLDDADADRIPAILEFVLLSDPTSPSNGETLEIKPDAPGLITLNRRTLLPGITLTVEVSSDLNAWSALPQDARLSTLLNQDGSTTETWALPDEQAFHARLKATR